MALNAIKNYLAQSHKVLFSYSSDLHKEKKQDLARDPTIFEAIFDYVSTIGKIKTDNFVGDHGIIMNSGNIMKISIHRDVSIYCKVSKFYKLFLPILFSDIIVKSMSDR